MIDWKGISQDMMGEVIPRLKQCSFCLLDLIMT